MERPDVDTMEKAAAVDPHVTLEVAVAYIRHLEGEFRKAMELIRQWHGMGTEPLQEAEMWELYLANAPEMGSLRETADQIPEDEG